MERTNNKLQHKPNSTVIYFTCTLMLFLLPSCMVIYIAMSAHQSQCNNLVTVSMTTTNKIQELQESYASLQAEYKRLTLEFSSNILDINSEVGKLEKDIIRNETKTTPRRWIDNWDKLANHRPSVKRVLYLVRHGDYNVNSDHMLTSLGHTQANITGQWLKRRERKYAIQFKRLISSTYHRCVQTSEHILKYFPTLSNLTDQMLIEGWAIPPRTNLDTFPKWEEYPYKADKKRLDLAFQKYFHRAEQNELSDVHEIIVAHSNMLRYLIMRALQFPVDIWSRVSIIHAAISVLTITPDGYVLLESLGDNTHIPIHLQSS
ncbi:unnamed protein product [Owenia fusiformis]|uniref:Serine/threonine-protein phosphatase PGAM5, mitochondrial n=1 Tax=Owenia fusiformis TaxID=6347 RepID=A0A8S4Q5Z4_OWEFU|nr:unnamed protein product [Owenia fusiformis]